jgi:hypothetical protein
MNDLAKEGEHQRAAHLGYTNLACVVRKAISSAQFACEQLDENLMDLVNCGILEPDDAIAQFLAYLEVLKNNLRKSLLNKEVR